jgi:hypothetical protein
MSEQTLPRTESGRLESYAWPGGYPIFYLDTDNSVLCPDCANKSDADDELPRFKPVAFGYIDTPDDDAPTCDQCGVVIGEMRKA